MDVFLTGARGSQQSPVLSHLLGRGHHVTALSRKAVAEREGVRWVQGDLNNVGAFKAEVRKVDALVFHRPVSAAPWPVTPLLDAAKTWGVERVVYNASAAVPPPGADGDAREVVDALAGRGLAATVLQPTLYLENLLLPFVLAGIQEGVLRYPLPDEGFGVRWIATQDLGTLTTRALESGIEGHFQVGGPESLDGASLAAAIGRGLGRTLRFEAVDPRDFGAQLEPLIGSDAAGSVSGLYSGIAGAPKSFSAWLDPDVSPVWSALEVEPTTVEAWSASTVRPLVGNA